MMLGSYQSFVHITLFTLPFAKLHAQQTMFTTDQISRKTDDAAAEYAAAIILPPATDCDIFVGLHSL